jgi:hypothetical protein
MALVIATLTIIPGASWRTSFADPCHVAVGAAMLVVVTLVMSRSLGDRWVWLERPVLAAFLAGMPLVYVGSCLWYPPAEGSLGWLRVELAGVPLFATVALLGMRRWPWLLAAGIAAHGLCWDSWHVGRTSFVPDWYAIGCLAMDVTLALYVVARMATWAGRTR